MFVNILNFVLAQICCYKFIHLLSYKLFRQKNVYLYTSKLSNKYFDCYEVIKDGREGSNSIKPVEIYSRFVNP